MIYDTVEILKTDHLPDLSYPSTVTLIYLSAVFEDKQPGFYVNIDGVWQPFGAGQSGPVVKTSVIETTNQTLIDLNDYDPDGLLLSVMVTKTVSGSRSISLLETSGGAVLETVILTNTYTTISVPQPHRLYSLDAESDLTITIKTI